MQRCFTSQQFLGYVNQYLKVKGPNVIEAKSRDELSSRNANLFVPDTLEFGMDVDLVICGPCAGFGTIGVLDQREYNDDFPMGKCLVAAGESDRSWLHAILVAQEKPVKNVVVFATCCGEYPERYEQMLRRLFPEITWHFPCVEDLCDNHHPDRIAKGLLEAGLLKIVPAPA